MAAGEVDLGDVREGEPRVLRPTGPRDHRLVRVDRVDRQAEVREPPGEPAGPAADVQRRPGAGRHVPEQQPVVVVVVVERHGLRRPRRARGRRAR